MKWKNNKVIENKGVNFVAEIVNDSQSIFNKIDGSNDVGLDGHIEFTENENVTGLCVGIQIKAGDSNLSANGENIYLKSDKEHFKYWKNHLLPIVGIVFIPNERKGYWIDITEYLSSKNNLIENGPYNILVPRENEFSAEKFESFHRHLKRYLSVYNKYWNFGKSLAQFVDNHCVEQRFEALKSLFFHHRNRKETWFYLIRQFGIEKDEFIQKHLIHTFNYLEGHGDTFWHKDNIIDQNIRNYGRGLIKKYFGIPELKMMLKNIDENGITRGTIGQDIHNLIDLVPNKIEMLKTIILDDSIDDSSRSYAGLIAIFDIQRYDKDRAINFAQSMITNFPNSDYNTHFEYLKEALEEYGYYHVYG